MKQVEIDFGRTVFPINIPDDTDILSMGRAAPLSQPEAAIEAALNRPAGTPPLSSIVKQKLGKNPKAEAVIVISDNTRPVPYSGPEGLLIPLVNKLEKSGIPSSRITLLVSTGTHHPLPESELKRFLDSRIFSRGLRIINHNSRDPGELVNIGRTPVGGDIRINRHYMQADIKILTGLVESHFMAGVSGGRKSICPGLLAEKSTYILHSGPILNSPYAADLMLENNPVHQEALQVARMAGCDFIINVTLDASYRLTGVFAGDLEKAHAQAVDRLKSYAVIPVQNKYDLVITHTGYVGINHYQAAKSALVASKLVNPGGGCLLGAYHPDSDPVGGKMYKKMMKLLGQTGHKEFLRRILSETWDFVPEQWEAQMWAKVFSRVQPDYFFYACRELPEDVFSWLPGTDARRYHSGPDDFCGLMKTALDTLSRRILKHSGRRIRTAFLPDGPYGVPQFHSS